MSTAAAPENCANCANCDKPLGGHYCSNCGQEAVLHHASTREFLHEFVGHYVALEGKLWGSLVRLLFRPGLLTNEYIRGRRVRFVQPLRLYLSFSLLFFALLKFGGHGAEIGDDDKDETPAAQMAVVEHAVKQSAALDKLKLDTPEERTHAAAAEAAIAAMQKDQQAAPDKRAPAKADAKVDVKADAKPAPAEPASVSEPEVRDGSDRKKARDEVDGWLEQRGWETLRHKWNALNSMSTEQQKAALQAGFYHYAPYAIFCLMPVFALYLKVLYLGSGRRFGEHVLFALHTNAFAFLIFSLMLVIRIGLIDFVLWCWLLGYLPWAMRRVYHSSRAGTLLRWSVLMFFYMISIGVALGLAGALGALTAH
jgi:hypothetical protein